MTLTESVRTARREPRKLALGVVMTLVLVAVVAPFVVYAVPQVVGADQSYVVLSGSMEPVISPGDVVIVTDVDPGAIAVGDIITFTRGNQDIPTTHRVVDVVTAEGGLAFRTMGDANEDPDAGTVPASAVLGRVAFTIPLLGHVVTAVNTSIGFALLVVAPFALLVVTEVYDWFVKPREEDAADDGVANGAREDEEMTGAREQYVDAADDPGASGFAVTSTDLTLVLVVLGVFAAYSGAVAYLTREEWSTLTSASIMLAVAAVGSLAFGLYVRHEAAEATFSATSTAATDGGQHERIVAGFPDVALRDSPRVTVESAGVLAEMADAANRWVVANPEDGTHALYVDGVAYVADTTGDGGADDGSNANDGSNNFDGSEDEEPALPEGR